MTIDQEWIQKTIAEIIMAQSKKKKVYALFGEKRTGETMDVLDQNLREIGVRMQVIDCGCERHTKDLIFDL